MKEGLFDLRPNEGEAAVLSLLAARDGDAWAAISGSLLTVPVEIAAMSWPKWADHQPPTRGPRYANDDPDLGAVFNEEPFPGLRIMRVVVEGGEWKALVRGIEGGQLAVAGDVYRLDHEELSASKLFTQHGLSDAHRVASGPKRPVRGVTATLHAPEPAESEDSWVKGGSSKPMMQQTREELRGKDIFFAWPRKLLGIDWSGSSELTPPPCFVIGKAQGGIWIADTVPDYENEQIKIVLAWDADRVDPLACSVLLRAERDGAPLLARHLKISDLPGEGDKNTKGKEARALAWNMRTIDVRLPRGPRRTDFGVSLLGPDGWLLDERPVVPRVEQVEMELGIMDAPGPASRSVIGDPNPAPTEAERDRAAAAARALEEQTRKVAAQRRLTTTGELKHYLRWRFSARAGELLVLDRYLFDRKGAEEVEEVIDFLAEFDRPIRALVSKSSTTAKNLLASYPEIEARKTSPKNFHDRLWIAGETAVLVGTSVNQFLQQGSVPATSAVDLPYADSTAWRDQFEIWWAEATSLR